VWEGRGLAEHVFDLAWGKPQQSYKHDATSQINPTGIIYIEREKERGRERKTLPKQRHTD
jgi:hypothetical protein